jgi:hypothetical protein
MYNFRTQNVFPDANVSEMDLVVIIWGRFGGTIPELGRPGRLLLLQVIGSQILD